MHNRLSSFNLNFIRLNDFLNIDENIFLKELFEKLIIRLKILYDI